MYIYMVCFLRYVFSSSLFFTQQLVFQSTLLDYYLYVSYYLYTTKFINTCFYFILSLIAATASPFPEWVTAFLKTFSLTGKIKSPNQCP